MNYYNEYDPKAAAWLRQLIVDGLIPDGRVDTRSIIDVQPGDLAGFAQCHFFAGIGGWALALELAGWPEDEPIWSGSCPCQPFSSAGKQEGFHDERHLWPHFHRLVSQCRPARVVGEQVASQIALEWFDGVSADLEGSDYACVAADLCAAGVGAPHIRQRLYWVADTYDSSEGLEPRGGSGLGVGGASEHAPLGFRRCGAVGGMGYAASGGQRINGCAPRGSGHADESVAFGGMGDTVVSRLERLPRHGDYRHQPRRINANEVGSAPASGWDGFAVVECADGRARRFEPGSFPLAHGLPGRVGLLRGYGNAIVPQVAAKFIVASDEAIRLQRAGV